MPAPLALALAAACGGEAGDPPDGAVDATRDAIADAMPDATPDAIADVHSDAIADISPDAIADAITDAIADAATDATADASPDAEPPCDVALVAARADAGSLDPLDLGRAAAHGPALTVELALRNACARRLRFLGHPSDWIDGPGFALDRLPPILLDPGASTPLTLRFTPGDPGPAAGRLTLPYDRPGAPLRLDLAADVAGPRTLVFVGDGRHVVTTADYGAGVAHDAFETLEAHGDALQRGVCWGAGRFVAVGGNVDRRWWTSADGIDWAAHRADGGAIADCAFGDGRFVAAGGRPLWSLDGIEWQAGRDDGFDPNHLRAMTFGEGLFVAVGDGGRIASTADGTGWDRDIVAAVDGAGLRAVAYGDGVFVAVGGGGWLARSADGAETWQTTRVAEAGELAGVVFADGRFVAGDGARVFGSADGLDFAPINAAAAVPRLGFGRMLFGTAGGRLLRSDDGGFSWTAWHDSPDGLPVSRAAVEGL